MGCFTVKSVHVNVQNGLDFKDYLQTAERFRLDTERVEEFSFYLPTLLRLALRSEWINRFKDVDVDRVEWFRSQKDESIRRHDNHPLKYEHLSDLWEDTYY